MSARRFSFRSRLDVLLRPVAEAQGVLLTGCSARCAEAGSRRCAPRLVDQRGVQPSRPWPGLPDGPPAGRCEGSEISRCASKMPDHVFDQLVVRVRRCRARRCPPADRSCDPAADARRATWWRPAASSRPRGPPSNNSRSFLHLGERRRESRPACGRASAGAIEPCRQKICHSPPAPASCRPRRRAAPDRESD